jgi:hypothetical protein
MFVRIIKGRSKEYAVIVRGYRDIHGKVRHKTVKNLGPVTAGNREAMLEIGRKIIAQSQGHEIIVTGEEISEQARQNWGSPAVIEALWNSFGLDSLLHGKAAAIQLMLIDRLLDPASKLATYGRRRQYEGFENIALQDLYRDWIYLQIARSN